MNIDAHQHYWNPSRGDYGWLTPALDDLYRVFGPDDLMPLTAAADIQRTVVVQAAPTVAETRYLLDLASDNASIAGVIGWVPLDSPEAPALIRAFAQAPKFKGVRPMLQDVPDDRWIADAPLAPAIATLIDADLSFDALVYTRHLPALLAFAERYPTLRIVIDHAAKPPIAALHDAVAHGAPLVKQTAWQAWADAIASLAALPQGLHCKVSGLATEAGPDWTVETLRPYVEHLMRHFGPSRLLWGSDWPVLNRNGDYRRWHHAAQTLLADCMPAEVGTDSFGGIFGANAQRFYRL